MKGLAYSARWWRAAAYIALVVTLVMPIAEEARAQTKIFRCIVDGRTVFGDKPCPDGPSVEVSVVTHSTYKGAESVPARSAPQRSASRPASKPDRSVEIAEQKQQERCRNLSKQLAQIESTMRAGYKAQQGEKLRDRQRGLQERQSAERCR